MKAFCTSGGAHTFDLAPRQARAVELNVAGEPRIPSRPFDVLDEPGLESPEPALNDADFTSLDDLARRSKPLKIRVVVLMDGQAIGGMMFEIGAKPRQFGPIVRDPVVRTRPIVDGITDAAERQPDVTGARTRRVNLGIDIDE